MTIFPEEPIRGGRRRPSPEAVQASVIGPAARLCAAARVFVRHGEGLDATARARLLAQIDDAADGLQRAVTGLRSAERSA